MSDENNNESVNSKPEPQVTPDEPARVEETNKPEGTKSVEMGGIVVLAVIVLTLVWYLFADRNTPYTTQARIEAYIIGVAPKVGGLVTQIWVNNNQTVEAGQPLFEIDPSQYRIALNAAQAGLETARNQVSAGNAAVDAARAQYNAALASLDRAQKDASRQTTMYNEDSGTISVRRLESSQASLEVARASAVAAEAGIQAAIEQKGGDDEANNAILESARSAVEKAELDLSNTVVTASTQGVVTDLRAEIGQFAGAGNPVMTLVALNDLWISAQFTENNLGNLKTGTPVRILFDSLPGQIFTGEIRSIGVGVSFGTESPAGILPTIQNDRNWLRESQRFPVTISFDPNQSAELARHLRVGGQVSVMAFTKDSGILKFLGGIYLRIMSWFSYVY